MKQFLNNVFIVEIPACGHSPWIGEAIGGRRALFFKDALPFGNLPVGKWEIICTWKNCTEEKAVMIVDKATGGFFGNEHGYQDYLLIGPDMSPLKTAMLSLTSRIEAKDYDLNSDYVFIKTEQTID